MDAIILDTNRAFIFPIKTDLKDQIEVEVGDIKTPDKFYPQVKIKRWGNECNVSARLVDNEEMIMVQDQQIVNLIGVKKEINFFDLVADSQYPEGGFEFNIILKEKPVTNVFQFTLVDKDVDYFYQPALNKQPLPPRGVSATEMDVFDKDGKSIEHRPENVVGSYAVYAKTEKINLVGGQKYRCGKISHIYRPEIIDATGKKIWGQLNIANGILTVTIPQKFLDTAVYPVEVDPTFGYTTAGATSGVGPANEWCASNTNVTVSGVGVVDSMQWYGWSGASASFKGVICNSSLVILSNGVSAVQAIGGSPAAWQIVAYSTKPAVTAGTFLPGFVTNNNYDYYKDEIGSGAWRYVDGSNSYTTPTDPTDASTGTDKRSIYATYTLTNNVKKLIGCAQANVKKCVGATLATIKKIIGVLNA